MRIYHQSSFERWPLEDKSVQCIITSPPYYSLRRYKIPDVILGGQEGCEHEWGEKKGLQPKKLEQGCFCVRCNAWKGQYGLEPTAFEGEHSYLAHTMLWLKEAWRVLRDDGILFLNISDSYASSGGDSRHLGYFDPKYPRGRVGEFDEPTAYPQGKVKPKSLLLIPDRIRIMMVDMGWIIRNRIVWFKNNAMPESASDRFSRRYEDIIFAVKQQKYYFNLDVVREPYKDVSIERLHRAVSITNKWVNGADGQSPHGLSQSRPNTGYKARGKIYSSQMEYRRELWEERGLDISYQFSKEKRQAKKSEDPSGIFGCPRIENDKEIYKTRMKNKNHEYKTRDPERHVNPIGKNPGDIFFIPTQPSSYNHYAMFPEKLVKRLILCSTKPGDIVFDPFCGSGTTLKVADELNRIGIGIDLGYEDIQKQRLSKIQKKLFA